MYVGKTDSVRTTIHHSYDRHVVMNHRFGEATTELLVCFSYLDQKNSL
jgi:hypothetical protein